MELLSKNEFLDSSNIKAFFCLKDEKYRLPFFLQYYRRLGVREFYAVDNNSADGSGEYLLTQPDVHVFHTKESYRESNAGRKWTTELCQEYGRNSWCLTLDVDEFLIYPHSEYISLKVFCGYLERHGFIGIYCIFLDYYSDKLLSETVYNENDSVFDVCQYYDKPQSYSAYSSHYFPYVQIKGGIRQRTFWNREEPDSGPAMRKLPLVKWHDGFDYIHSTHSTTTIPLADVTGVLAHFKFLSHFKDYAISEVERNDRMGNSKDYKVYAKKLSKNDICFYDVEFSRRYLSSEQLIEDGMLSCTVKYFDFCFNKTCKQLNDENNKDYSIVNEYRRSRRETLRENLRIINYRDLVNVWPVFAECQGTTVVGGRKIEARDIYALQAIENRVISVFSSRTWKITRPLRLLCVRFGLLDEKALLEDNYDRYSLYTIMEYTYGSIWWDITGPFRAVGRVIRKIKEGF